MDVHAVAASAITRAHSMLHLIIDCSALDKLVAYTKQLTGQCLRMT